MAKKGRPQKPGKRASNRPSRAGLVIPFDKGSEWVQAMRARYGDNYNSAIGRAYAAGLLDDPRDEHRAKTRLDNARKFAKLYIRSIGEDRYRCPLNQSPRGGYAEYIPNPRDAEDYDWLLTNARRIDETGGRPFFDQLIGKQFTDSGPDWLNALLGAPKDRRDLLILNAALKALDAIGPVHSRQPDSLTFPPQRLVCGSN